MIGKTLSINTPDIRFLRAQTWIWAQLRRYCESNWETYCAERKTGYPWPVSDSTPAAVAAWCDQFGTRRGRKQPAIVGAAAMFRRDFVRLVAVAMPHLGIESPGHPDPVDKAIADSPDWTSAVQVAFADVQSEVGRQKWTPCVMFTPPVAGA